MRPFDFEGRGAPHHGRSLLANALPIGHPAPSHMVTNEVFAFTAIVGLRYEYRSASDKKQIGTRGYRLFWRWSS
jgi:hypothetical protein